MDWVTELIILMSILLFLLVIGLWIPVAIAVAGLSFLLLISGPESLHVLGTIAYNNVNSFTLTAVPLFVLMGELVLRSGLMTKFYRSLSLWLRWLPGGLLHTNIVACAIMAAVTGSSVATAGAVGSAAIPELRSAGYPPKLIYGTIAAGGTLGILIPPSIIMIVYGALSEQSVSSLFIAGIVPGLLMALAFSIFVAAYIFVHPQSVADVKVEAVDWRERIHGLVDLVPIVALLCAVIFTIYGSLATPTEAGAIGAVLTAAVVAAYGKLTMPCVRDAVLHTIQLSSMVVFIVVGAAVISYALVVSGINRGLADSVVRLGLSRYLLLALICVLLLVLGMFIDGISMIYLTLPILLPIVVESGFNLIWFGVIVTILVELGQISPPMGLNLFVIKSIDRSIDLASIVKGALPFAVIQLLLIVLLTVFPTIALWLVPSGVLG